MYTLFSALSGRNYILIYIKIQNSESKVEIFSFISTISGKTTLIKNVSSQLWIYYFIFFRLQSVFSLKVIFGNMLQILCFGTIHKVYTRGSLNCRDTKKNVQQTRDIAI